MKAGIFTFQYAYNYGAVLQCLGLYRAIMKLGVEVDVIRYVPLGFCHYPPVWRGWGVKQGLFFDNLPRKWIAARNGPAMIEAFDRFRDTHLSFSAPCTTDEEIAETAAGYDALIAGSDQVWHFAQAEAFFLEWGAVYDGLRISYAPCCGHKEQPQERLGQIKEWLARFDHISVRNDFSKDIIDGTTGTSVPIVADPAFLSDLSDVQQEVKLPCSEYILMYTLGDEIEGGHAEMIRAIRKKVGDLPVVAVIPSAHKPHLAPWADIKIWEAGPAEWLYLIANAAYVYTDSFHGAAFAMKYHKNFLAYYSEKERSHRLMDLAERYAIQSCVAGSVTEGIKSLSSDLDYNRTDCLIADHVEQSMAYLKNALCTENLKVTDKQSPIAAELH